MTARCAQRHCVSVTRWPGLYLQVYFAGKVGLRRGVLQRSKEQAPISIDTDVHAASIDCGGTIVIHLLLDANAKSERRMVDLSEAYTQFQLAARFHHLSREQRDITVTAWKETFQPTLIDSPVL